MSGRIIRTIFYILFFHIGGFVSSQTAIYVDNSLLNRSFRITEVKDYLDSNKIAESTWILINTLKQSKEAAATLANRIKSDKTDEEFIQFVEDVFWSYLPHINLIPDSATGEFYVFEDYFFWKNELISFATRYGKEALQWDEQAQQQMAQGKLADAVKSYSASLELLPDARRYYRRAQLYEALDENGEALSDYNSAIMLRPYPTHYFARGELNMRLRFLDDAIGDFSAVIDSEFEYLLHGAYYNRALCYGLKASLNSDKKSRELSIFDFTKAIELHPTAEAYKRRGVAYYGIENMEASKKDFMQAIELDPNDAQSYFFLATYKDNFKKRIALLDKCIELIRDDRATPTLRRNAIGLRGIIYYDNGKKKKACEDFQRAMELGDQESTEHYYNLCGKYKKKKGK